MSTSWHSLTAGGARALCAFALLLAPACVDDIGNTTPGSQTPAASAVTITANASGHTATIDATAADQWQLLDLDAPAAVKGQRSADVTWDLAFQRFSVRVNSGVSGPGQASVARVAGIHFDDLAVAPSAGWTVDTADAADDDDKDDLAVAVLGDWYAYDASSHKLTPLDVVYAVRTTEGAYKKLQFQGYYDAAGTSGWVTVRWGDLQAPPAQPDPQPLLVDASSKTSFAWIRLVDQKVVTSDTDAVLADWDLAVQRTSWRTASAAVGGLGGAAALADPSANSVDTVGFAVDAEQPAAGPPGAPAVLANPVLTGWYNYDPTSHAVTPKDVAFAIRSRSGSYFKLRVLSYESGQYALDIAPLQAAPASHTLTVNATSKTAWTYMDLAGGTVLDAVETPPDRWDLAAQRTLWRTNGGASGAGAGGAWLAPGLFDALQEVPATATFLADALAALPGPPGSGEAPQNQVLSDWYNYDATTHAVSPKPAVFVVRLHDASFAKVQVTDYDAGVYQLRYTYAGPGRSSFGPDGQ